MEGLKGKIFITGGSGFLARGIYRRAEKEKWDCEFTCYSRDEEKQQRIRDRWNINCILGDVRDSINLNNTIKGHDLVIHTAAIKFVPEAEYNVWETVKVNIDGMRNVALASRNQQIPKLIGISTDKAVLPVNIYGMSKAILERCFSEANKWGLRTRAMIVRYGNVVGSSGSIVPVFQRQLKEKGKVSVTNPNATRFWLSVDEAIDTILLAIENMENEPGAVIIPRCGAMSIGDLASVIAGEAPVDIVGMRVGEKEHEVLVHHQESARTESLGDYFLIHPATWRVREVPDESWTYISHSPAFQIKKEDMARMIEEVSEL